MSRSTTPVVDAWRSTRSPDDHLVVGQALKGAGQWSAPFLFLIRAPATTTIPDAWQPQIKNKIKSENYCAGRGREGRF